MATNKEVQEAFVQGYLKGLAEKDRAPSSYEVMRKTPTGLGAAQVNNELFKDRIVGGTQEGLMSGIMAAIASGLIGLGLGATIGAPVEGAATLAALGGALGYAGGNAKGQLKADKKYLNRRGLIAKRPLPVKELALNPTLSAAVPVSSYSKITRKRKK